MSNNERLLGAVLWFCSSPRLCMQRVEREKKSSWPFRESSVRVDVQDAGGWPVGKASVCHQWPDHQVKPTHPYIYENPFPPPFFILWLSLTICKSVHYSSLSQFAMQRGGPHRADTVSCCHVISPREKQSPENGKRHIISQGYWCSVSRSYHCEYHHHHQDHSHLASPCGV